MGNTRGRTCGGTKSTILRGPRSGDWRGKHLPYSRPSSSFPRKIYNFAGTPESFHFLGGSQFRLRQGFAPIRGQNTWTPHLRRHKIFHFAGAPFGRLAGETFFLTRGLPAPPSRGCSPRRWASASSEQSPLAFVSACGETYGRSLAPPLPTKFIILRGPRSCDWRGNVSFIRGLPAPPSTGCSRHQTASASRRGD